MPHGPHGAGPACYRPLKAREEGLGIMAYEIDLSGRVAFITGASSGLGAQFAKTLAAAGAGVVLAARRIERLKTLRAEIESQGGDAHVVGLDVTDPGSIRAAVAHAETEMGAIDILVNNSGVSTTQKLTEVTPEDYDYVMDTNTRGALLRRAGSGQAHDRAQQGRSARHLHRRAHRQHRLDGGAEGAVADRRLRHEQGGGWCT